MFFKSVLEGGRESVSHKWTYRAVRWQLNKPDLKSSFVLKIMWGGLKFRLLRFFLMRPIPSHTNGIFPFPNFNLSPNFSALVLGGMRFWRNASLYFLAVQNSSIGDLVTDSLTHSLTHWLLLLPYKDQSWRLATIPSFLTLIFYPHFLPLFLTLLFDPPFWPSFLNLIFDPHFWQFERQYWRLDIWDTDYNSDNWEPEFRQSFLPDN